MVPFRLANPTTEMSPVTSEKEAKRSQGYCKPLCPTFFNNHSESLPFTLPKLWPGIRSWDVTAKQNVVKIVFIFYKGNMPIRKESYHSMSSPKKAVFWIQEIRPPKLKTEWLWNFRQITFWRKKEARPVIGTPSKQKNNLSIHGKNILLLGPI